MAINAAQLFVKISRLDKLRSSVEEYLKFWTQQNQAQWPDLPFLSGSTARETLLLPVASGWSLVLDPDPHSVDHELASYLSEALKTRVIALEVSGSELSLAYAIYSGGKLVTDECEPVPPSEEEATSGPMPIYHDPISAAVRLLKTEGVPKRYWMMRPEDLTSISAGSANALWAVGFVSKPDENKVTAAEATPFEPLSDERVIISKPGMVRKTEDDRNLYIEIRTLFGHPSHEAINSILETEREERNRLLSPFIGMQDKYIPELRFEYTTHTGGNEALMKHLGLQRNNYFETRPPKIDFLNTALKTAESEHPSWHELTPEGFGIRFKTSDSNDFRSIDLGSCYEEYMSGHLRAATPSSAISIYIENAASDILSVSSESKLADLRARLMPMVSTTDEAIRQASHDVPSMPIGAGLSFMIHCRVGDGWALIDTHDLERWQVSFDGIMQVARRNLLTIEEELMANPLWVDIGADKKAVAFFSQQAPSRLIMLPNLKEKLKSLLNTENILVAVPDATSFLAMDGSDPMSENALREFARQRGMVADMALSSDVFRVTDSEPVPLVSNEE